ncbi:MAG: hypothetical protein HGN29_16975 [Asgard group archaeon]|nr:hypothetical protein [Asgard group archaeon]
MEFKLLKTMDKISLIFICLGVMCQIVLQILLYVLYFFIPAIIIGLGFILFGVSQIIENSREEKKEKRSYEAIRFFHDRPMIISILSLIVGIIIPLGELFYQKGQVWDIFEMIIIGDVFRAIRILALVILSTAMIFLSFFYKKKDKLEMILILPEILLIITLFALFSVNIGDFFFYSCYSVFQYPSCFPSEYYIITTSFIVFLAIFFVKLVYIIQLRKDFVSQKELDSLEVKKEEMKKDNDITLEETPPPNIFRLIKEAFTPVSRWKWKYNSKKHFIVRFILSLVISVGLFIGVFFLVLN